MSVTAEALLARASVASVRDAAGWIMLIKKLPTASSPPKLSIFWSTPWPYEPAVAHWNALREEIVKDRFDGDPTGVEDRVARATREAFDESPYGEFGLPGGVNPDMLNARAIRFDGEKIRVWPHEFSVLPPDRMRYYVVDSGAYRLEPEDVTEGSPLVKLMRDVTLDTDQRFVRDAAMVDGCTEEQALLVALGEEILEPSEFAPLGWYKLTDQRAIDTYCDEDEAKEHRQRQTPLRRPARATLHPIKSHGEGDG